MYILLLFYNVILTRSNNVTLLLKEALIAFTIRANAPESCASSASVVTGKGIHDYNLSDIVVYLDYHYP
jgi:hypothetical protein